MNGSNSGRELQSSGTMPPPDAILRLHSNPVAMVTTCLLDLWPCPLDACSDLLRLPLVGVDEGVGEVKMKVWSGVLVAALGAAWLALKGSRRMSPLPELGVDVGRTGVGVGGEEEEGGEGWTVKVGRGIVVWGTGVGAMEELKMFTKLVLAATPVGEGVAGAWNAVVDETTRDSVAMGTAPLSSTSTMMVVSALGSSAGCMNVT